MEYISIEIPCPEQELYQDDAVIVTFHTKDGKQYTLCNEPMISTIDIFNILLQKAQ